jgi:hypothetical protein
MERYSSTDGSVVVADAAVAIEAAATVALEVADTVAICQLGRGSLTTLPPVVHPRTTRPAAASAAAGEEWVAEARGGGGF